MSWQDGAGQEPVTTSYRNFQSEKVLQVFFGQFHPEISDILIHMLVDQENGGYKSFVYDFASTDVWHSLQEQFMKARKVDVVYFLEQSLKDSSLGPVWGHLYQYVAHIILSNGGDFKRKRVWENVRGKDHKEDIDRLKQEKLEYAEFKHCTS